MTAELGDTAIISAADVQRVYDEVRAEQARTLEWTPLRFSTATKTHIYEIQKWADGWSADAFYLNGDWDAWLEEGTTLASCMAACERHAAGVS